MIVDPQREHLQKGRKYEVDVLDHLNAKVNAIFSNFDKMSVRAINPYISPNK